LDPDNSAELAKILKGLAAQGKTLVVSTQDMLFAELLQGKRFNMNQYGELT
jgi:ABC-type polar amino acid transport system ATPase subunit